MTLRPEKTIGSRSRSFYEQRYQAAARVYTGDKASMVRQNNAQIIKYVEEINPVPRDFVPPVQHKVRDLIVDAGELDEEDLGKRYWLVRRSTPRGPRSRKVYADLPGLYDIDKTLFSKGTLGTLLSYRTLLNARVVERVSNHEARTPARAVGIRRNTLPSSFANEGKISPERSLGFNSEHEPHSVTLRFFLENGTASKDLYAPPTAGRIVLNKLKLVLGLHGVEAVDIFEVYHKGNLTWTAVRWTSPILARPGDMLFFRKAGVIHMLGWEIDRLYL